MVLNQQILSSALTALAHAGYTYTSAVMDIIDNSAEEYVGATRIALTSDVKDGVIERIIIADDGIGMDRATLEQAIYLGSRTGKKADTNLGVYGMGLKTAAMSLGYLLEVYTKRRGSNELLYGSWDIPRTRDTETNGKVIIQKTRETKESSMIRKYAHSEFGTVVVISELRSIKNVRPQTFSKNMSRNVGIHFNKFINNGKIKFYVNDRLVPYIDPIGDNIGNDVTLLGEGCINIQGKTIKYKAWNIHPFVDDDNENDDTNFIPRTLANQGIYIYRQGRLVGNALTLGLFSRRTAINGFRVELFMDGTCDELFCSSFTKVIQEKKREDIDPELYEQLKDRLSDYWNRVEREYKKDMDRKREEDPEMKALLEQICQMANGNNNIQLNRSHKREEKKEEREQKKREKQEKENDNKKENKENNTGKQDDLYEPIKRKHRWLEAIKLRDFGNKRLVDIVDGGTNNVTVYINTGHPYYTKVIEPLKEYDNAPLLSKVILMLISFELVHRETGYYNGDSGMQSILDGFESSLGKQSFDLLS